MRHVAGLILSALSAVPALGGVVGPTAPLLSLQAGGVCASPPQGATLAPGTRDGQVTQHVQPYDFVQNGDDLVGAPDMGIGLVIQLKDFTPGEGLTLQGQLLGVDPKPDSWPHTLRSDGILWFGFMPDRGKPIDPGHYRFLVKRGAVTLLTYDFHVRKATPAETRLCPSATS